MDNYNVFIIAEAGVNHNGNIEIAKKLIDVAAEAGADAIKFQTFKSEAVVSMLAPKAEYQKQTTGSDESQLEMIRQLELPFSEHQGLIDYCNKKGIMFLSTAFDRESADFLHQLNLECYKIPSGEITNYPLLKQIGGFQKPILLSTGMSTMEEVKAALSVLRESGTKDITLLHCNTQYPTPFSDVNLTAMETMRKETNCPIGYSDHTSGIEVAVAAVAMGACVIEKHFTLDKHMDGPDHKASLEPDELKAMISAIRNVEKAMGDGKKIPSQSEYLNIGIVRKSIVAKTDIKIGDVFTESNLTTKRPGMGISPMKWNEIIGTKAKQSYKKDEIIVN